MKPSSNSAESGIGSGRACTPHLPLPARNCHTRNSRPPALAATVPRTPATQGSPSHRSPRITTLPRHFPLSTDSTNPFPRPLPLLASTRHSPRFPLHSRGNLVRVHPLPRLDQLPLSAFLPIPPAQRGRNHSMDYSGNSCKVILVPRARETNCRSGSRRFDNDEGPSRPLETGM